MKFLWPPAANGLHSADGEGQLQFSFNYTFIVADRKRFSSLRRLRITFINGISIFVFNFVYSSSFLVSFFYPDVYITYIRIYYSINRMQNYILL